MVRHVRLIVGSFCLISGMTCAMDEQERFAATKAWAADIPAMAADWWQDPAHMAEVIPTLPCFGQVLADKVRACDSVVEVGAGTGTVTRELLNVLSAEARLDVVEYKERSHRRLVANLGHRQDDRFQLHCAAIQHWQPPIEGREYEGLVSTLPRTKLPDTEMQEVCPALAQLIKPGGLYVSVMIGTAEPTTRALFVADYLRMKALHELLRYPRESLRRPSRGILWQWMSRGLDWENAMEGAERGRQDFEQMLSFTKRWEEANFDLISHEVTCRNYFPTHVFVRRKKGGDGQPCGVLEQQGVEGSG